MRRWLNSIWQCWSLTLATRLARVTGHIVVHPDPLTTIILEASRLRQYTVSSGHLTRAYHAGRKVREFANNVEDLVMQAIPLTSTDLRVITRATPLPRSLS